MLFLVSIFSIAHPVYEGRFTVEFSASFRHRLHVENGFLKRVIVVGVAIITDLGTRDARVVEF